MGNNDELAQRYLTVNDLAIYLHISPKTVYYWLEEGKLPSFKLGRLWRFDRIVIDEYLREGKFENICYNKPTCRRVERNKEVA